MIRRPLAGLLLIACTGLLPTTLVLAKEARPGDPEAWLAVAVKDFGYKEYSDSGQLLDREDGMLPGAELGASFVANDWVLAAGLRYHAGTVVYDGQTTLGASVESRTDTVVVDGDVLLGRRFRVQAVEVTPYVTLGYHYWDRDIRATQTASGRSVSGLHETYSWYTAGLGARAAVAVAPDTRLMLDARVFRIERPTMKLHASNVHDELTLALGEENGWRVGLPIDYAVNANTTLSIEAYIEAWEFGRSAAQDLTLGGVVVASAYEPRSETRASGVIVGLRYRF